MSDEFKDVSTVPTLTLEPFQEEEKKKPVVQPEEPKLDDTILTEEERRMAVSQPAMPLYSLSPATACFLP